MSKETLNWLNEMTLIGDTDKRGKAWHYRAGAQNHFPDAIPLERVGELFEPFEPVAAPVYIGVEDDDGEETERFHLEDRYAIVPKDHPRTVLNIVKNSFTIHGYQEWLTKQLANLVHGEVHVSSAGLLERGGVAWVELALNENQFAAGFEFRPHLLAFTSVNGKFQTTYGTKVQAVVCDNTLSAAAREGGNQIKVKHSKYSKVKLQDARDALGLIVDTGDDMIAEIKRLYTTKVSGHQWNLILDEFVPVKDKDGSPLDGAALTKAEKLRQTFGDLWAHDDRVSPWRGTGLGVVQAFNTYQHHYKPVRTTLNGTTDRAHRNMLSAIDGSVDKDTELVYAAMNKVLSA